MSADPQLGYAPLLEDLLVLYPQLGSHQPAWRAGYDEVAHLAHGWYMRCHRGVMSVMRLGEAGYAEEAAPIRRSIIEHCLALRWLAAEGNKILDTVARGHAYDTARRSEAVGAAGWTSVALDEFARAIASDDPDSRDASGDHMLHFANRIAQYGDKHTWPGYLAECSKTHPSYESSMSYVQVPSGALLWEPKDPLWQVPFCTTHMLEAVLAVRTAFDPSPWETEVQRITQQFLVVTDAVRKSKGLPAVDCNTGT